jgi:hypothetical protein
MASYDVASNICQTLRHPTHYQPSFLYSTASYDVASDVRQTLLHGDGNGEA